VKGKAMATKKIAAVVPVAKAMTATVFRNMSPRVEKEFTEELAAKIGMGCKVTGITRGPGGVTIHMVKTEEWTFEELMNEVRAHFDR